MTLLLTTAYCNKVRTMILISDIEPTPVQRRIEDLGYAPRNLDKDTETSKHIDLDSWAGLRLPRLGSAFKGTCKCDCEAVAN